MFTVEVYFRQQRHAYQFEQMVVLVGRARDNDIVLLDRFASAHHCMFIQVSEQFFLRDRNSRNGTRLGGRWVRGQHLVNPEHDIVIGETLIRIRGDHDGGDRTKKIRIVPLGEEWETTPTKDIRLIGYEPPQGDFQDEPTPIPSPHPSTPPQVIPLHRPKDAPTRASLRGLLLQVMDAAQLRAFLIDHFPDIARQVPSDMESMKVVSLLLERASPLEVLRCLQLAFPHECAEHWSLLQWE